MWDIILDLLTRCAVSGVFDDTTADLLETASSHFFGDKEVLARLLRETLQRDHPEIAEKIARLLRRRMNRTRNSNGNPNRVKNP